MITDTFRRRNGRCACSLAVVLMVLSGCESDLRRDPEPRWPAPPEPSSYIYPEDPPVGNSNSLQNLLAGFRSQGHVVLLDIWSTAYQPSCDRFPDLIDLYHALRPEGFQCVAVAFDNPALWNVQISPFLRSMRCDYPCAIVPPSAQEEVARRFAREWRGEVPARLIFDREGRLAAELLTDEAIRTTAQVVRDVLAGQYKAPEPVKRAEPAGVTARTRTLEVTSERTVVQPTTQRSTMADIESMAQSIARQSEETIDWSNAHVAILPFTLVGRSDSETAGKTLADAVARILRAGHPESVVDRQEADELIARYKLTPMAVEYDPSLVAGKANWTHIITGALRWR
jgi:hypothetical protein